MREIIFRGKRVDNNEWVYGDLNQCNYENEMYILVFEGVESGQSLFKAIKVMPETVGQFTGLTDKNGVKIFEGDMNEKGQIVSYFEKLACYGFKSPNNSAITFLGQFKGEIIGNIHE